MRGWLATMSSTACGSTSRPALGFSPGSLRIVQTLPTMSPCCSPSAFARRAPVNNRNLSSAE